MKTIKYQKDHLNIAHIIFSRPDSDVNLMDWTFAQDLADVVSQAISDEVVGVILRSDKETFFAGGDIAMLVATNESNAERLYDMSMTMKRAMRKLETSGLPVVAAINGSALGGGYELALSCHYRICIDDRKIKVGLPEVNLGLLPGAGGVTRMVRKFGITTALPYLTDGKLLNAKHALANGLVDKLVSNGELLLQEAQSWVLATSERSKNEDQQPIQQSYDVKGYKLPNGEPDEPKVAQAIALASAKLIAKTHGTLPAPKLILAAAVEGARVSFAAAEKIESQYFVQLAKSQISKNLINSFWFGSKKVNSTIRAVVPEPQAMFSEIAILGAGMMGSGIALACASKGVRVKLFDVSVEKAQFGKAFVERQLSKQLQQGRINSQQLDKTLALIECCDNQSYNQQQLAQCQLVIEAVNEDKALKMSLIEQVAAVCPANCIIASNTSTLPISSLAIAAKQAANFIGMHFFSPVQKMPLVELICGENTADQTLNRAWHFVRGLGKTPIVVNDSRGFYTTRVFLMYVKEGIALLDECYAASIENAAFVNGFAVGPLAVCDEVSLSLLADIEQQARIDGDQFAPHPCNDSVAQMLSIGRLGRACGKGFYDYCQGKQGTKKLWPQLHSELNSHFLNSNEQQIAFDDIKDRLLFIMALETVHCVEQGVIECVASANLGAVMGIGYPQWTGGTLQFIDQYGLTNFIQRAEYLANKYGERFNPPALLKQMAQSGKQFI